MAARLIRSSAPLRLNHPSSSSSSSSVTSNCSSLRCMNKVDKFNYKNEETKSKVAMKASVATGFPISAMQPQTKHATTLIDIPLTIVQIAAAALTTVFRPLVKVKRQMSWKLVVQMAIEKGVTDCRFFAFFAVAGSLLGSALCFFEGFSLVLQSYLDYFKTMSKGSDEGHLVQLLIEAIDMFLVGSAVLLFGMGLYTMFVGTRNMNKNGGLFSGSNFLGLFHLKMVPAWVEMQSVSQAKSHLGHSVLMILQVGVLDKFKSVPLVTPLDLACFAGAVTISSACIFLLSRLSKDGDNGRWLPSL